MIIDEYIRKTQGYVVRKKCNDQILNVQLLRLEGSVLSHIYIVPFNATTPSLSLFFGNVTILVILNVNVAVTYYCNSDESCTP